MTCIVGLQHKGRVFLGGDSAANAGTGSTPAGAPKVWARDGYVMGYAGSFRAGQLLQYDAALPVLPRRTGKHLDAFMVTEFAPAVRDCFIAQGVSANTGEVPGWPILLGVAGVLYHLDLDFAAHRSRDGYMSVGCGDELALGALYATRRGVYADCPRYRVELALKAAVHHSTGVRGPLKVVSA